MGRGGQLALDTDEAETRWKGRTLRKNSELYIFWVGGDKKQQSKDV